MKKSISIVMALILILAFCLPLTIAFARAEPCDFCPNGTVRKHTKVVDRTVNCTHGYPGGRDVEVTTYYDYICDTCGTVAYSDVVTKVTCTHGKSES